MSKDKTVPPDSELCANPKCGHLYTKGRVLLCVGSMVGKI